MYIKQTKPTKFVVFNTELAGLKAIPCSPDMGLNRYSTGVGRLMNHAGLDIPYNVHL